MSTMPTKEEEVPDHWDNAGFRESNSLNTIDKISLP
jgi:hypothetical protein